MKKLLVGVDGSEPSLKAIRKATEYATALKAQLVLAYVLAPMNHLAEAYAGPITDLEEADRKNAEVMLRDAAKSVREAGCPVEAVILRGPPAQTLAERAEQDEGVEMVVVGSRGLGAVASVILGSVTDRLVRVSKKPVLVIH